MPGFCFHREAQRKSRSVRRLSIIETDPPKYRGLTCYSCGATIQVRMV